MTSEAPGGPEEAGRPDTYALLTLGDVFELGQGVLSESRARRTTNAARLVRHLFEYDIESEWILKDVGQRVERRVAEDIRHVTDELPPDDVAHLDLDRAREFVHSVRASLPRKEIGPRGELIPSRRAMAKEKGAVEEYDRIYAVLSWLAHPSMVPGSRRVRLMDDDGAAALATARESCGRNRRPGPSGP